MSNTTGKGGRLLPPVRAAKKEIFLSYYSACHSVRKAAKAAGISVNTPANWIKNGTLTEADLAYALGNYQDEIRERYTFIDGYDPFFGTPSKRQIRILAFRHLPELRAPKFGEMRVNTLWWDDAELAELKRVIDKNTASAQARKEAYHREQYEMHNCDN
jgi:hypothetical protein